jgi:predicted RNA-binding Zn-ribbon protein involved in translation (DUF1610 family)
MLSLLLLTDLQSTGILLVLRLLLGSVIVLSALYIAIDSMFQRDWECEKCGIWVVTRTKKCWQQSKQVGCCPICNEVLRPARWALMGMSVFYLVIGIFMGVVYFRALGYLLTEGNLLAIVIDTVFCAAFVVLGIGTAFWRFRSRVKCCPQCRIYVVARRVREVDRAAPATKIEDGESGL